MSRTRQTHGKHTRGTYGARSAKKEQTVLATDNVAKTHTHTTRGDVEKEEGGEGGGWVVPEEDVSDGGDASRVTWLRPDREAASVYAGSQGER